MLLSKHDDGISEEIFSKVFGGVALAGGVVYGGVSIPFWVASKKRKKERDLLLRLYE